MLAGLQQRSPILPGIDFDLFNPGVAPSYEDIITGRDLVKYDKIPVKVKSYHVKVYDMMSGDDRKAYEDCMLELTRGVQTATHAIMRNDLQVMQTPEGGKWFRYLEWAEYELNEPLLTRGVDVPRGQDVVAMPMGGVIQEVGRI